MAKNIEHKGFNVEFRLQGIELLKGTLNLPPSIDISLANLNFEINVESKVDAQNKLIFMIVHVEIKSEDQLHLLGALSVSCIYYVENYEKLIKILDDGRLDLPKPFLDMLNSISISTTRGVMFSTFKGTFLHNAILPIINPQQLQNATSE
jgi:hypothetical protein